ncbi:MAG: hypothetical protein ACHQJ7_06390 [Vicinamibacteria bacterium]|jgi:hypothetical protein
MRRFALLVALAVFAANAHALDALTGARAVTFDGKRMVHADEGKTPVEHWREFVPPGETLERWTRLASVREYPNHRDPKALAGELVRALQRSYPGAPFSLIESKATGEVIVDFVAWPADHAFTEFNLFRYGTRDAGGVVAQQYALRVYGDAGNFLRGLKAERVRLLDVMAKDGLKAAR